MNNRGRPKGRMTRRRQQVLETLIDAAANGERITLARIARKCGLDSYRDARRIRNDLYQIGALG